MKTILFTEGSLTTSIVQIFIINCSDAHITPSLVTSISLAVLFFHAFGE